ncbi:MFS transporter [Pseudonocardia endophytica]|uniref:EmrB/QacA subfamily drug resistance transporter n=1 Tax=Pseudonocardia endophytica TaxID=401976 RepID=A0A4R1HTR5_PSEEN|nr:MFS transporter [Pseudonocardia endophytica]TCK24781.1 EmrB/QacA subfamily drug resistance transporter [Pseudonocardia endophytica]
MTSRTTVTGAARRLVLAGMTVANAMILVDQTAVPLVLPDIADDFGVSSLLVQWVLNASLLPLAGLLVLGGRLGDVLGRRKVFLVGAVLFAGASAVGGLAPSFAVLLGARVCQGVGGALMLPATIAIVGAAFDRNERGRALGTMGGIAATAGALGPTIGGALTSLISWRAVLLINLPLLVVTVWATLRAVPRDEPGDGNRSVDVAGAVLACIALMGLVFGLAQTTTWSWTSPGVLVPLALAVVAGVLFVVRERRAAQPLMDPRLLRSRRNYLGATISQGVAGMAEMGLGLIFPLLLILNLRMNPGLAGIALLATTVPMVVVAPLVGRWYDRGGGRPPLVVGFAVLALAGLLLAAGVGPQNFWWLLPGLLAYGVGLAIVLTVNDPVSLDMVPDRDQGQVSGVSATAEQGGGAVGIALLYAVFHSTYVAVLNDQVAEKGLPALTPERGAALRDAIENAEQVGLDPRTFDPRLAEYLLATRAASTAGYTVVFLVSSVLALAGLVATAFLVRRPPPDDSGPDGAEPVGEDTRSA